MGSIAQWDGSLAIVNKLGEPYMVIDNPKAARARWEREANSSSPLIASAAQANLALLDAAMEAERSKQLGRIGRAALGYASRGWAIIPLEPRGKRPAGRLVPHGVKQATTDLETITSWWSQKEYNIGLACGAPSGIWALDVDGEEGEASLAALEADYGVLPPTLEQITGGGGRQLFWRLPQSAKIKNSVRRLGAGLDVRSDGGYVVIPPSIHPSGKRYRWAIKADIAFPPDWLVGLLAKKQEDKALSLKQFRFVLPADGTISRSKRNGLVGAVMRAPVGQRNNALYWAACRMAELGLGVEQIFAELGGVAMEKGLSEREIRSTITSAVRANHV